MEESRCSGPLFNLFCNEDRALLEGDEEDGLTSESAVSDEEEYIETLVFRENTFERRNSAVFSADVSSAEWLKYARSAAVRWILKTREFFGFSPQTAYLSLVYLDRFFVKRTIDMRQTWAIQLLSVACLSLAAKMEECRVPALTEYPGEECEFEGQAIQRMEILVLNTLEWRMGSITPFLYLDHFASKFVPSRSGKIGLFSRATELILASVEGMNLVDHRPSAVAAAAVFMAAGQPLTKAHLEGRIGAVSPCKSFEIDRAISSYNLMTTIIQDSCKSQESLPTGSPCSGNANESFFIGTVCNKKRRLTLSSCDGDSAAAGRSNLK